MRISTAQLQERGLNAILDRQELLSHTQQQLATGKRILSPSDDVYATTQALALNKVIATHKQYQENTNVAESRLQQEETAIDEVVNALQRIRELAVQANNASTGDMDRESIAVEIRQRLEGIVAVANSLDSDGEYIFAGNNVDTPPVQVTALGGGLFNYSYTGDSGQRMLQIGNSRQIAVGDPGDEVFFSVPVSGGGTQNVFETIEQYALDLEANTPTGVILDDLLLAIDHIGSFRAKTGARQNVIDSHRVLNDDIILQGNKALSDVQDLDFAEAVSRMNLQLVGLEASQQSFAKIQGLSLFNFI
jgi:flagellar hook-associated protein 3 FlgL